MSVVLCVAVLAGCGGTFGPATGGTPGTGPCTSGVWGSSRSGSNMEPGMACRACHLSRSEGPRDAFMGTAYTALDDADRCVNTAVPADAVVEILDTNDVVKLTLPINSVGNFLSTRSSTISPYKARVRTGTKINAMSAPQTDGDCNGCHAAVGKNGAPGRVLIP